MYNSIVGYVYQADTYCTRCIFARVPGIPPMGNSELALDMLADQRGITRDDERTFNSNEFPEVIFSYSACGVEAGYEHEYCGTCGHDLCGGSLG